MEPGELIELQRAVREIHVSSALIAYVQAIAEHTRRSPDFEAGLQSARRPVPCCVLPAHGA
ncbi:MAG: hypothetical protein M5R42_01395 [Rhodocyclaceae bacterium]|nr:hypothetical protein [Rhodocyclaceae bacterium]